MDWSHDLQSRGNGAFHSRVGQDEGVPDGLGRIADNKKPKKQLTFHNSLFYSVFHVTEPSSVMDGCGSPLDKRISTQIMDAFFHASGLLSSTWTLEEDIG